MIDITQHIQLLNKAILVNFKLYQQSEKLMGNDCPDLDYLDSDGWDEVSESLFFALVSTPHNRDFGEYGLYSLENRENIEIELPQVAPTLIGTEKTENSITWVESEGANGELFYFVEFGNPCLPRNEEYFSYVVGLSKAGKRISAKLSDVRFKIQESNNKMEQAQF